MITNIVVHPKGATHFQKLFHTYFMKLVDGVWFFWGPHAKCWIQDLDLNDTNINNREWNRAKLTPIR